MPSVQYRLFSKVISLLPMRIRVSILFFRRFRYFKDFNASANLETFNEKIQYLKLHERDPLLTIAADKIASKKFVKEICPQIYVPKNLWVGRNEVDIDTLDYSQLPNDYVFKANHTSQTIEIIRSGNHLSRDRMKKLGQGWLSHDQASSLGEWAYQEIPRSIFIEEFLDFCGQAPDDYKFFVYNGQVHFIQLDSDRFINHKRNMFDRDWNELGFCFSHERKIPIPDKPKFLNEMINYAERIGEKFKFVRVDLYYYKNRVAYGELTIYPGAGFERFPDLKWDATFGKPLKLTQ